MYVRVVRFSDVDSERVQRLAKEVEESDAPPPGVPATGFQLLEDESQGTAIVLQLFETADDMQAGAKVLGEMDPSETPGNRASVDMCELKLDKRLS